MLKDLYRDYGDSVAFVTLYVREAHPGDRYPQPETFEQKTQYARIYKERDEIPWPVAVDDVKGTLHQRLDPRPNAAYLMDTNGNVAFRSLWSNDKPVLRAGLEAALSHPQQVVGESEPKVVPMLASMGDMYEMLEFAGQDAKRDVLQEMPPVYAMARLADVFRPLPPLTRGIVSAAVSVMGVALAIMGLRWLLKPREDRAE